MAPLWVKPAKAREARFTVEVQPTDSIADVKKAIAAAKGHQAPHLRLIYQGLVLRDDAKLGELNLPADAHFILHVRLPQEAAPAAPKEPTVPLSVAVAPQALPAVPAGPISNPGALFSASDVSNILHNLSVQFGVAPAANAGAAPAAAAASLAAAPASGSPAVQVPITRAAQPRPAGLPQSVFDAQVDAASVQSLLEMGFPEVRARKALLLNGGRLPAAMDWLFEHANDADIDSPVMKPPAAAPASATINVPLAAPPAVLQQNAVHPEAESCIQRGVCTIVASGRRYIPQYYHHCYTCGFSTNEGCCVACVRNCHAGHNVSPPIYSPGFWCDCGSGARTACKSLPPGFHLEPPGQQ